jgi:hypothetical protein
VQLGNITADDGRCCSGSIAETPKAETTWRVHVVVAASAVICAMLLARSFDLELDQFLPNEMVSDLVTTRHDFANSDQPRCQLVCLANSSKYHECWRAGAL